ncbi:unnamed protein product [Ilex paraguariensis]|uniref:Oleosin n=1 Tax=Ilex paraguariensis TaxID=185542 RepID=A0ABC8SX47_9AQUA
MADRDRPQPHHIQIRPQSQYARPQKGPSASKVLAVITLLPVGGTLLGLSGVTLVGTLIFLAVTTPLFVIFSPVLVPATITLGLVVIAFLTSGALGLTGLSSLTWVLKYFRQAGGSMPEQLNHAKRRMQDVTGPGPMDQTIQNKGQEVGKEARRT